MFKNITEEREREIHAGSIYDPNSHDYVERRKGRANMMKKSYDKHLNNLYEQLMNPDKIKYGIDWDRV